MSQRHDTQTIDLTDIKDCAIAVISDTHGKPHPAMFPTLERSRPSLILHAGDVGDPRILTELKKISRTVFVRGNVDPSGPAWPDSVTLQIRIGKTARLDLLLLHIGVTHLRLNKNALSLLQQNPARIVVFGHSHVPFLGLDGAITLFNPGSAGPPRFRLPITMGSMEIASDRLKFKHLDLKTGKEWTPG